MLEQVDLLVRQDPRYRQLGGRTAGVVFDSAPCFMAWGVGAAALGHGLAWPLRALAALLFLAVSLLMPHRPAQFWCVGVGRVGIWRALLWADTLHRCRTWGRRTISTTTCLPPTQRPHPLPAGGT